MFTAPGSDFSGNPAAVVVMPHHILSPNSWYCGIATSSTIRDSICGTALKYSVVEARLQPSLVHPATEVDLCGHATLATACTLALRYCGPRR